MGRRLELPGAGALRAGGSCGHKRPRRVLPSLLARGQGRHALRSLCKTLHARAVWLLEQQPRIQPTPQWQGFGVLSNVCRGFVCPAAHYKSA